MKNIIITLLICGISLTTFSQTTSSSKNEKIRKLLELSGSGKLGVQVANNMIPALKQAHPNVDQKFWDEFSKEIKAEDLVSLVVPIYDKYYTEDDIDQLINFYNSPIGKKTIEVSPMLTQESIVVGQAWGKMIGEKVVQRLTDKGYLKN